MSIRTLVGLAMILPFAPLLSQGPATQIDVPVKSVMLFSSGVGYFEHSGTVRGNGSTELRFKTAQINDILKSLVLEDLDGGKVTTITYPSQDPLAKTLRSFQIDITANPSLASLLNQLRGAKVSIQSQAEKLSGTVLGVETRQKMSDKGEGSDVPVLNLLTGATIRAVELPSISSLSLDDPQLQDELTKALAALSQARDQDKKPVTINFTGNGDRRIRIGYVVETPVWKTSYRLLLDDKASKLQGWAIVENQTESDWTNVSLSLVSGRPISFMMDLYQPLYAPRPTVVPELFAGLRPQTYDGGISTNTDRVTMATAPAVQGGTYPGAVGGGGGGGRGGRGGGGGATGSALDISKNAFEDVTTIPPADLSQKLAASVHSAASSGNMGELFQYTVPNVTLPRQKSAMIPIVTDTVGIDRLSIYNAAVLPKNPLNGVRLKNSTGKHLLQGPLTVLDKGGYAGDARIDDVPPGQSRLLSYGVDLEMTVDNTKNSQTADIVTGKIVKGVLTLDRRLVSTQEYAAENKGSKEKTLVVEHPIKPGWKLVDTQKPIETTPGYYRFQGSAPAGKVTVLTVKEEITRGESMMILSGNTTQLLTYSRTGEIPSAVRDALTRAMQMKAALAETDQQISAKGTEISSISEEQDRIRENMKTVDSKTAYYQRLLEKLNDQETSIEKLQKDRDTLQAKRDTQYNELGNYLSTLTVG